MVRKKSSEVEGIAGAMGLLLPDYGIAYTDKDKWLKLAFALHRQIDGARKWTADRRYSLVVAVTQRRQKGQSIKTACLDLAAVEPWLSLVKSKGGRIARATALRDRYQRETGKAFEAWADGKGTIKEVVRRDPGGKYSRFK